MNYAENRLPGRLAVIVHADIAGSTALVRQDEQAAHEHIQNTFRHFSETVTKYHGHVCELRGDALLAEFERASDAVTAALAFQAEHTNNEQLDNSIQPTVRVGIAMGEVIIADRTVTGAGVVLAQRVEQLAEPGTLCVTGAIHEALPERMPFDQEDLGEQEVRGFEEAVRVYRVALKPGESIPPPEQKHKPMALSGAGKTAVVAIVITLVATGVAFWLKPWAVREEPASAERMAFPLPDKPSIAVLPFNNMSDDEQQEYFVDGITEDLITDLSQISGLFVIARNSVFTYKGKVVKVRQVAEELGVRYVMEGSVRRVGNQVRINAQLIDATTGGHLWAKRYDGLLDDVFALQDHVTGKIVSALTIELTPEETERSQKRETDNTEAYDAYLRGQEQFRRGTPKSYAQAVDHFERAVALDPTYSRAYAALASVYWNSARNGWSRELGLTYTEAASQSREYLYQAMNEPSALAHQVASERASHLRRGSDEALAEARGAIALDSNDPAGHMAMANALIKAKQPGEAVESIQHAMRLDPHYPASYLRRLGRAQLANREFKAAATMLESAIERNPQDEWAMVFLAAVYGHMDRKEAAVDIIQKVNALRTTLGKGALTWENVDVELYISRTSRTSFVGMKGDRDVLREGLRKAGIDWGFGWSGLISTIDKDKYEVNGATTINAERAKKLHESGVPFIDIDARAWSQGHIPNSHLMEWFDGEFNEQRLSQVVDRDEEVVISGRYHYRNVAAASAEAVTWGFRKVYYFPEGLRGWRRMGYVVEQEK